MSQQYLTEFVGVLLIVYVYLISENPLAVGAMFAVLLLVTQNISNAGFNPAIAITLASNGKIKIDELIPYCVAQILGGLTALKLFDRYKV
jgi:glycerol uptake facilitator-like aquaporin